MLCINKGLTIAFLCDLHHLNVYTCNIHNTLQANLLNYLMNVYSKHPLACCCVGKRLVKMHYLVLVLPILKLHIFVTFRIKKKSLFLLILVLSKETLIIFVQTKPEHGKWRKHDTRESMAPFSHLLSFA